jgi:hypothetical protein
MRTRSMSPKRSRSSSPKRNKTVVKPSSPVRKTLLDKTFETKNYQQYMQWILLAVVFAVYITCLVLYLTNYTKVRDAVETHFDFTSSFLYKPWFVILLLTLSMLGFLYVIRHLRTFILPILFLFAVLFTFFILSFIFTYNKVPTQQSATPQIMSAIGFIALVILTIFIVPYVKNPFFSLVCLLPTYFLLVNGIYLGGVMNRVWIA